MNVYLARSPDRSRIRIQTRPYATGELPGWERRSGTVTPDEYRASFEAPLGTVDDVDVEAAHQNLWARLAPTPA